MNHLTMGTFTAYYYNDIYCFIEWIFTCSILVSAPSRSFGNPDTQCAHVLSLSKFEYE